MRGGLVWVLVVSIAAAGCTDAKAPKGGDLQDSLDSYDVDVTPKTAALRGVVVDSSIRPIAGAAVAVSGLNISTTTKEDGLFGFADLEPGVYFLSVSAPDFLPVQQSAELVAGKISDIRVLLELDPAPRPYHNTYAFEWFDEAGVTLVDFAIDLVDRTFLNDTIPDACDVCYFHFAVDGAYETLIIEAVWEDSVAPPTGDSYYFWTLDSLDDNEYEADYFTSPGRVVIDGERFGGVTNYGFGMTGDENWITFQQDAEIFITVFYHEPAPEGWSFIAGDP